MPPPPCCFVSHCDLDLYPIECQINKEYLLSLTNVCMKFEKAGPYQTLVTDWTRLYTTDRRTERQVQSNITLFFERGGGTKSSLAFDKTV